MHDAKWLFPQEKATLYELKKVYVYSENALIPCSDAVVAASPEKVLGAEPRLLCTGNVVRRATALLIRQESNAIAFPTLPRSIPKIYGKARCPFLVRISSGFGSFR
jgi:hypothetical protein